MINNFYKIKNNTLIGIDEKRFKKYLLDNNGKNLTIPKWVVFIGEYVFKNNLKLKEVILPKSTIAIYKQAFMNCSNL